MTSPASGIAKPLIGFSLFTIVALVLTYIIYSTLERSVAGDTISFSTYFTDASGLATGDDVRMAGVRVGRVDGIALDNGRAKVSFEIQNTAPIYTTTKAAIRYQNLIGQRYLALSLTDGERQRLPVGASLRQPSEDSFDVTKLLAGFQPVFDTLSPDEVNSLSNGLIQAFQGNSVSLSTTIAQVGDMASDMANRDVVIRAIITNLSTVLRDLARQGGQIGTLVNGMGAVVGNLNVHSAEFGRAVSSIGATAAGFADVLSRSRGDLAAAASAARQATTTLIGSGSQLDSMATDLPNFLGHFVNVLGQGAYLNIYVCDLDIAIGDVLFPPGVISKIGGTNHSAVCR